MKPFHSLRMHVEEAARTVEYLWRDEAEKALMALKTTKERLAANKLGLVVPLVVLLGIAIYLYVRAAPKVAESATFELKMSDFDIKMTERGELRALDSVAVSAQKDLPLIYLAPEGKYVKKGEVLARLDPSRYEVAFEESKAALQVARAELKKAEKDLEAQRQRLLAEIARFEAEVLLAEMELNNLQKKPLKDELEKAKMELERAKVAYENAESKLKVLPDLLKKGFITRSTLEDAELKYLEAKASLQLAQSNFEKVSAGATREELEKAKIMLKQANVGLEKAKSGMDSQLQSFRAAVEREMANVERTQKLLETAKSKLEKTELQAPRDGLVVYAKAGPNQAEKIQLGMIPYEGQPLIYLPDTSTMVVDTEVNEIDIGKVKVGGSVDVRVEAYPGAVFDGEILQIGSIAKTKQTRPGGSGIKVFDVTVKIEDKDPRLKPGLTAAVDFIVDHQKDVLAVPMSAVVWQGGEPRVFVANGRNVEERRIVLGGSNEQRVIVTKGLREGERVLLAPTAPELS